MNRKWIKLRAMAMQMSEEDVVEFDRECDRYDEQAGNDDELEAWGQQMRDEAEWLNRMNAAADAALPCDNCGRPGAHDYDGRRFCDDRCRDEYDYERSE